MVRSRDRTRVHEVALRQLPIIRLATCCNVHRASNTLPRNRLTVRVLSSHRPRPHDTIRRPQCPSLNSDKRTSTRVLSSPSQPTMAHPPSTPSTETIIAQGEDEAQLKDRLKGLIADSASEGLWSMSPDRMGLERQISFRTFKLCWVGRILNLHTILRADSDLQQTRNS